MLACTRSIACEVLGLGTRDWELSHSGDFNVEASCDTEETLCLQLPFMMQSEKAGSAEGGIQGGLWPVF
jgi:hypothetical protein